MARRRLEVFGVWLGLLLFAGVMYPVLQSNLGAPDYSVPSSDSARAEAVMAERFPALGAEQDAVVFRSHRYLADTAEYRRLVGQVLATVRGRPGVITVSNPYDAASGGRISADRHVAVALVATKGNAAARARLADDVQQRIGRQTAGGPVEAYLVGASPLNNDLSRVELHDQEVSEAIGIPVALAVLLITMGALVAALLPIVLALASVLVCLGVLALLADPLHLDSLVTVITTMIGTGVGIDYALFIVSRFREELAQRTTRSGRCGPEEIERAVGVATHTAGGTVAASGLLVIFALSSLIVIDGHIFLEIAVASSLVVACSVIAGLTLLPALLAALGHRVDAGTLPRLPTAFASVRRGAPGRWGAWARFLLRRPVRTGLPVLLLLGALIVPATSIRLGFDLGFEALNDTPSGQGQRILSTSFSPGTVGPVHVIGCAPKAPLGSSHLDAFGKLATSLRGDRRVAEVTPDKVGPADIDAGRRCAHIAVVPSQSADSADSRSLVVDIRRKLAPAAFADTPTQLHVGGLTAQHLDLSDEISDKLPWVVAITLALSFCYLLVVFRSLLLPVKAILLNLLATAAALGATALVFQHGHGADLLGFTPSGTLQAYLPVVLFALLFGLSMDYEVFLVRRIREEWLRSGDNTHAVALGLERTAREITAGAAIMAAVFGSFLFADVLELKEFGFALATAVILDATLVRMVLVPAVMGLGSAANWWLPGFLTHRLDRLCQVVEKRLSGRAGPSVVKQTCAARPQRCAAGAERPASTVWPEVSRCLLPPAR